MSEMNDLDLIGYCDLHCETERALFHADHINRMIALAGYPKNFPRKVVDVKWVSTHEDMKELCKLARARMKLLASPPPDNVVSFRKREHA
jgi:hypothetical protein